MNVWKLTAIPIAMLCAAGCESTTTGQEGNFTFSYPAEEGVLDFDKPLAVGASLDLTVAAADSGADVQLDRATSSDADVFTVTGHEGAQVTVRGVGDGEATLEVRGAAGDGPTLSDKLTLRARVPDAHELAHACDGPVAYLAGGSAALRSQLKAGGEAVIGYGLQPVTVDATDTQVDTDWQSSSLIRLQLGAPGEITVTSQVDGSTLDLTLKPDTAIDGAQMPIPFGLEQVDVGFRQPFVTRPLAGGDTLCQADTPLVARSLTPTTCSAQAIAPMAAPGTVLALEPGWFEVEGLAAGMCEVELLYSATGMGTVFGTSIQ